MEHDKVEENDNVEKRDYDEVEGDNVEETDEMNNAIFVAEGEVEVDDVEDDEVQWDEDGDVEGGKNDEEEEGDDDRDDDVAEEDRSQDRTHTLCEHAQSKCAWTCHNNEYGTL